METKQKLTSVKLDENLYHAGQIEFTKRKFSLTKLVSRAIYLYINDEDFRRKITSTNID
jgi:hypothetical protein